LLPDDPRYTRDHGSGGVGGSMATSDLSLTAVRESEAEAQPPKSLTFWKVAFAILVGNLMTAVVGAIIYAAVR
jgi:hypothetical protein